MVCPHRATITTRGSVDSRVGVFELRQKLLSNHDLETVAGDNFPDDDKFPALNLPQGETGEL